jgi:predicted outer membrane protein
MRNILILLALCCYLPACDGPSRAENIDTLSDAQAYGIMWAIGMAEVIEAAPGQNNALTSGTQLFANTLANDGSAELHRLELYGIQSYPTTTSNSVEANARDEEGLLIQLSGADFDREYLDYEIVAHLDRIKLLTHGVLPYAGKTLQNNIRDCIEQEQSHLTAVTHVRQGLK